MSTFATIIELYKFKEVTFYSLILEGEQKPLGMQFLENHGKHPHFRVLMTWLKKIGNDYSAAQYFFRPEKKADALPPPRDITHEVCDLRWYCLRMTQSSVVVFNGGVKTTRKAQHCPNVKGHFHQANFLSEKIWASFDSKEISLDNNDRLVVEKDYKLNL